jgi:hypothetical protein
VGRVRKISESGSEDRSISVRASQPRRASSATRGCEMSTNVTSWPAAWNPSPVAAPTTPEPTMKILDDCMYCPPNSLAIDPIASTDDGFAVSRSPIEQVGCYVT